MPKFYSPGMVTAEIQFMVSVLFYAYLAKHHMATGLEYVLGALFMIIAFMMMQKSLVKIIGIKSYFEVPKMVLKRIKSKS